MDISSIGGFSTETHRPYMAILKVDLSKMSLDRVAQRLIAAREAVGLGPSEFADTVGIDRSSFSKIEAGKKPLKADMAFAISERWGFPMDFLYKGTLQDLPKKYAETVIKNLNNLER